MSKSKKQTAKTTNWVKNYIGHGKHIEKIENGVEVVIDITAAEAFIFEYEGNKYLKFALVARKEADKYGRTHTAYLSTKVEA